MSDNNKHYNSWIVFVKESTTADQLAQLSNQNIFNANIQTGNIDDAIKFLASNNIKEKFLLLEITDHKNIIQKIDELAEYCAEDTHLICLGYENSIDLYRQLVQAGVDDYHTIPINTSVLSDSIANIQSSNEPNKEEIKLNPMISVIGSRGGLGTSTIASSISWLLSNDFKSTTCLLDLDIYNGISSLIFNKDPNQGLSQALSNIDRLDAVFLKRISLDVSKNLAILGAEQGIDHDYFITDDDLIKLSKLIRSNFDHTVVDINYNNLYSSIALSQSSDIIIVSDFSISSIRDTSKILKICKVKAPFAKIKILGIKNSLAKSSELTQTQFEDGIQQTIDYTIGFDRKATLESLNLGIVFAKKYPRNPIIRQLRIMLSSITKSSVQEEKLTWLEKIKNWKL